MSGSGRGMNESLRSIRMLACCLLTLNTLCRAPFTTALAASADARTGPKVRFRGITRGDPERAENPLAEELRYLSGESVWSWSNIFEIGSPWKLVASDRAARSTGQRCTLMVFCGHLSIFQRAALPAAWPSRKWLATKSPGVICGCLLWRRNSCPLDVVPLLPVRLPLSGAPQAFSDLLAAQPDRQVLHLII